MSFIQRHDQIMSVYWAWVWQPFSQSVLDWMEPRQVWHASSRCKSNCSIHHFLHDKLIWICLIASCSCEVGCLLLALNVSQLATCPRFCQHLLKQLLLKSAFDWSASYMCSVWVNTIHLVDPWCKYLSSPEYIDQVTLAAGSPPPIQTSIVCFLSM